jgi:hypothetical protein
MGYVWHPQHGYVLVQLTQPAAPPPPFYPASTVPQMQAPPQPAYAPPQGGNMGRVLPFPNMTSQIVKPGDVDGYAAILAGAPELLPDSGYNADEGRPSPLSEQALSEAGGGGSSFTIRDHKTGVVLGQGGSGGVRMGVGMAQPGEGTPAFGRSVTVTTSGPQLGATPAPATPWVTPPDPKGAA